MNPPPQNELRGSVDHFSPPAKLRGWVLWRVAGVLQPGLRVEARRGAEVLASAEPAHPRQDATRDAAHLAGFTLDCSGRGQVADFFSGIVTIWLVTPLGTSMQLPFWEVTLADMRQHLALTPFRHAGGEQAAQVLAALAESKQLTAAEAVTLRDAHTKLLRAKAPVAARRTKITFIGAGSTVFAKNLIGDILLHPALMACRICLYDIDAERLRVSRVVAERIVRELGVTAEISATLDITQALDGADYAINMIQVGGYKPATVTDFELPKQFGLRQTIADTLGIGGIMRALRTIPVLLKMSRVMEQLCPDVLHINYTNPMAMNCWALSRASSINTIGLCHSVPHTAGELAHDLGIAPESIDYQVAGINHMAFYLKLEAGGQDLYPALRKLAAAGTVPEGNRVRYDMLQRLGYFVTESSEHFAEYVPWYIKRDRPELIERFNIPLDEYPRRCLSQIAGWAELAASLTDLQTPLEIKPSLEYGSRIINAMETGEPVSIYGNVPNRGIITNLPEGCCVEVPCLVDHNGVQPVRIGALPPQLAALMQTNIAPQGLAVEAALTGRREHIYHAAMLDPHTAAELSLDEIYALVDKMIEAHGELLPGYS